MLHTWEEVGIRWPRWAIEGKGRCREAGKGVGVKVDLGGVGEKCGNGGHKLNACVKYQRINKNTN